MEDYSLKKCIFVFIVILSSLLTVLVSAVTSTSSIINNDLNINVVDNKEFRAVWISTLTSDIKPYAGEASFKGEMNEVFAVMEHYKLNAMIFHIRTHNNALYNSKLNPVAGWWKTVDFNKFDPLAWLIDECHKRGIEFHAWMNPYRLGNSHYYGSTVPTINPDSNPANRINSILNPGLPNVREFLIDTVMEVIENYDVDAIHFDDYFYTNLGANGMLTGSKTILDEPDQSTFLAYPGNYDTSSAFDKADWRREQVNLFIEGLSNEIRKYNSLNNKHIQLGISPTGIYKNGDGVVNYDSNGKPITTGSATNGQTHYSSYLFADSLKWISEGWLDYILPQSYWATNHSVASYYDVMGWWDKVAKNLDVNLYSGIGVYQADELNRFAWMDDPTELYKQLSYVEELENVNGVSFYSYKHLKNAYKGSTSKSAQQLANIGSTIWHEIKLIPEIKSMDPISLGKVSNFNANRNTISWDKLDEAKFYIIYRDSEEINFTNNEIIDVIGSNDNLIIYEDDVSGDYVYGIRAMSYTNTLGEGATPNIIIPDPIYDINFYADNEIIATFKSNVIFDLPHIPTKVGYDHVLPIWNKTDFSNLTADTRVDAIYVINKYEIKFYDKDDQLIENVIVDHGQDATAPTPPIVDGYNFIEWDKDLRKVTSDLEVKSIYELVENPVEEKPEIPSNSCKAFNNKSILILIGFALFMYIKRRKII